MKQKSFSKKLVLSKTTVSSLNLEELNNANGGLSGYYTDIQHCWTMYKDQCWSNAATYCPTVRCC